MLHFSLHIKRATSYLLFCCGFFACLSCAQDVDTRNQLLKKWDYTGAFKGHIEFFENDSAVVTGNGTVSYTYQLDESASKLTTYAMDSETVYDIDFLENDTLQMHMSSQSKYGIENEYLIKEPIKLVPSK